MCHRIQWLICKAGAFCIGLRLHILNERQEGDNNGKNTCFTPNGCSVVDYVIASADLQHRIAGLHTTTYTCTDHCPLTFSLDIIGQQCSSQGKTINFQRPIKLNQELFTQKQHDRKVLNTLYQIKWCMPYDTVDVAAGKIKNLIVGLLVEPRSVRTAKTNKWFDSECKIKKRKVNDVRNSLPSLMIPISETFTIRKRKCIRV